MRGKVISRLYAIGFASMLAALLIPGTTEAARGGFGTVVAPIPAAPGQMSLVVNSQPHAMPAVAIPRHSVRYERISYRRIIRSHIITVAPGPSAARSFRPSGATRNNLVFNERFPRVSAPQGSILIVRGDTIGFVLFP